MESTKSIVQYKKCKRLQIRSDKPFITAYDGNIVEETTLNVEIIPAALQLIIPQGASLK